jgi:hypothetical protein
VEYVVTNYYWIHYFQKEKTSIFSLNETYL